MSAKCRPIEDGEAYEARPEKAVVAKEKERKEKRRSRGTSCNSNVVASKLKSTSQRRWSWILLLLAGRWRRQAKHVCMCRTLVTGDVRDVKERGGEKKLCKGQGTLDVLAPSTQCREDTPRSRSATMRVALLNAYEVLVSSRRCRWGRWGRRNQSGHFGHSVHSLLASDGIAGMEGQEEKCCWKERSAV